MTLTKNEQIAALMKELENSDEEVLLTVGYMMELFDTIGFENWKRMYGYQSRTYTERAMKQIGNLSFPHDHCYIVISKQPNRELQEGDDENL